MEGQTSYSTILSAYRTAQDKIAQASRKKITTLRQHLGHVSLLNSLSEHIDNNLMSSSSLCSIEEKQSLIGAKAQSTKTAPLPLSYNF